jgi:hypothetical protein
MIIDVIMTAVIIVVMVIIADVSGVADERGSCDSVSCSAGASSFFVI